MDLGGYAYLWDEHDAGWALARVSPLPGETRPRFAIVNTRDRSALVIEDDAVFEAVTQEMLRHGVPIMAPGTWSPEA